MPFQYWSFSWSAFQPFQLPTGQRLTARFGRAISDFCVADRLSGFCCTSRNYISTSVFIYVVLEPRLPICNRASVNLSRAWINIGPNGLEGCGPSQPSFELPKGPVLSLNTPQSVQQPTMSLSDSTAPGDWAPSRDSINIGPQRHPKGGTGSVPSHFSLCQTKKKKKSRTARRPSLPFQPM